MVTSKQRIFLSYARDDDEPFVKRLYESLCDTFDVWWDRVNMPSRGLAFLQEIRDAVTKCDRMILVVGPAAMTSEYVSAEWHFAQVMGKPVIPVLRKGDYDLLPNALKNFDCRDFREDKQYTAQVKRLIEQLHEDLPEMGDLHGVPWLPAYYINRGTDVDDLVDQLTPETVEPVAILSKKQKHALYGMGGLGKTTLAAALGRHINTRRRFPDGIFWIELGGEWRERGETPPIPMRQADIGEAFGQARDQYPDAARGKSNLTALLEDKAVLLILDDVWDHQHAEPFCVLGPRGRLLITTRQENEAMRMGAVRHQVDTLTEDEGLRLFAERLNRPTADLPDPASLREIMKFLGGHTLAVSIAAAWLEEHGGANDAAGLLRRLHKHKTDGKTLFDDLKLEPGVRQLDLEYALSLSYTDLDADLKRRFRALGALAVETVITVEMTAGLWGDEDADDAEDRLYKLLRLGLLYEVSAEKTFSQHTLLNVYAQALLQRPGEWLSPDADEWNTVRRLHAEYFKGLARRWWDKNHSYLLAPHLPNLEAAFVFAQEQNDGELIYRLAWDCQRMLDMQGLWDRRESWLQIALKAVQGDDDENRKRRSNAQSALAEIAANRGDWDQAETLLRAALEISETLREKGDAAVKKGKLADIAANRGEWDQAEGLRREVLAVYEALGDRQGAAVSKGKLADIAAQRGEWDQAEGLFREVLTAFEALGDRREIAVRKGKLADIAAQRGEWDQAEGLYREELAVYEALGARRGAAVSKGKLADIAAKRGEWEQAEGLYREALTAFETLGDRQQAAVSKGKLADIAVQRGEWDRAEGLRREVLAEYEALGDRRGAAVSKGKLADIAAQRGKWDQAEGLYREALAMCRLLGALWDETVFSYNFALRQYRRGRLDEAISLMERVVELETQLHHPDLANDQAMLDQWKRERGGAG